MEALKVVHSLLMFTDFSSIQESRSISLDLIYPVVIMEGCMDRWLAILYVF